MVRVEKEILAWRSKPSTVARLGLELFKIRVRVRVRDEGLRKRSKHGDLNPLLLLG
jgi:hypothetical protein